MRGRNLGAAILLLVGATLLLGGAAGGVIQRVLQGGARSAVGWGYVVAPTAGGIIGVLWLGFRWWTRRAPFAVAAAEPTAALWFGSALVAGTGIGAFAGALHGVQGSMHWSAVIGCFVFLDLCLLTEILAARPLRAATAMTVTSAAYAASAQVAWSLTKLGRLQAWTEITLSAAAFLCGGLVALAVVAPWRTRLLDRFERLRRAAPSPDPTAPPRRA